MNSAPCLCELHNIQSQVGEVCFGHGLRLKLITEGQLDVIDRSSHRYTGRWQGFRPWFLEQEPQADYSKHVDGDPAGAISLFRVALVLFFGEEVKFGPIVCMKETDNGSLGGIVQWDRITERFTMGKPDEFSITSGNVGLLTTVFNQLVQGFRAPLLEIPINRLLTAKASKAIPSDAIIDQCIALEALYLNGDGDKKNSIARRGAAFSGVDSASREQIFLNLWCFYLARNSIVHEGQEHPTIALTSGASKGCVELRDWCFEYLRTVFRKILGDAKYLNMDKSLFIKELKANAKKCKSEFDRLEKLVRNVRAT